MKQAIHVATGIQGLTFSVGSDGVWMNTNGGGVHSCLNLSNIGKNEESDSGIVSGLLKWCKEMDARYRSGTRKDQQ